MERVGRLSRRPVQLEAAHGNSDVIVAGQQLQLSAFAQPPKPQVTPSTKILQLAAEHDTSPEVAD